MISNMKADELIRYLNDTYGIGQRWPQTLEVDAYTYAHACQAIFEKNVEQHKVVSGGVMIMPLAVGRVNFGIIFKNIELILNG